MEKIYSANQARYRFFGGKYRLIEQAKPMGAFSKYLVWLSNSTGCSITRFPYRSLHPYRSPIF